jgi:uncharacterized protein (DUF433 family)
MAGRTKGIIVPEPNQGHNSTREVEAMTLLIEANPVPLRADPDGTIHVVGTRLTLDRIATTYRDGAPPEEIVKRFPGLSLSDAYAVIAYCLRPPREVEVYLDPRRQEAAAIREEIESGDPPKILPRSTAGAARGEIRGNGIVEEQNRISVSSVP